MPTMHLLRIIRSNNLWKKGQKVWIAYYTGDLAYQCIGRFRGNGRWILGWVHCDSSNPHEVFRTKPGARYVGEVEVSQEFYNYCLFIIARILKNDYAFSGF